MQKAIESKTAAKRDRPRRSRSEKPRGSQPTAGRGLGKLESGKPSNPSAPMTEKKAMAAIRRKVGPERPGRAPSGRPLTGHEKRNLKGTQMVEVGGKIMPIHAVLAGLGLAKEVAGVVASKSKPAREDRSARAKSAAPVLVRTAVKDMKDPSAYRPVMEEGKLTKDGLSGVTSMAGTMLGNKLKYRGPTIHSVKHRQVRTTDGSFRNCVEVRATEPLGPITGSTTYKCYSFVGNCGNSTMCPWASRISAGFDLFKFEDFCMEFKTEAPSSRQGRVGIMIDYEASDLPPPDRTTFETQKGFVACQPWENLECHMRRPPASHSAFYYVADGMDPDGDPRVTNQFLVNVMTADFTDTEATAITGELFASYTLVLMEETLTNNSSGPVGGWYLQKVQSLAARNNTLAIATAELQGTTVYGCLVAPGDGVQPSVVAGSATGWGVYVTEGNVSDTTMAVSFQLFPPALQAWTTALMQTGGGANNPLRAGSYIVGYTLSFRSAAADGNTGGGSITPSGGVTGHTTVWNTDAQVCNQFLVVRDSAGITMSGWTRIDVSSAVPGMLIITITQDAAAAAHFTLCRFETVRLWAQSVGAGPSSGPQMYFTESKGTVGTTRGICCCPPPCSAADMPIITWDRSSELSTGGTALSLLMDAAKSGRPVAPPKAAIPKSANAAPPPPPDIEECDVKCVAPPCTPVAAAAVKWQVLPAGHDPSLLPIPSPHAGRPSQIEVSERPPRTRSMEPRAAPTAEFAEWIKLRASANAVKS